MKYQEFMIQIGQGKLRPVYLFHGEEGFLMEEAVARLKKAILAPGFEDLNYHLLNASSTRPAEIVHLCQTLPFFSSEPLAWPGRAQDQSPGSASDWAGPGGIGSEANRPPHTMRRLVVVRDIEVLSGSETLIPYLDNPSSTSCLVLVAGKVDERKRLFSALRAQGTVVAFTPLNDAQVKAWIKEVTGSMGITPSPEAVAYLQEVLGHDLYQIRNELEKIFLTVGPGAVGVEEVQSLLVGERGHTVFEWLDALRRRDLEKAVRLLALLLDSGEHPLSLLGLLISSLRRVGRTGDSERKGSMSLAWGHVDLTSALTLCLEADSRLKGSRLAPHLILEDLIINLCGKGDQNEIKRDVGLSSGLSSRTGFWS
jgi:DNA polymerase-3 subunit delta